ncbi:MAG: hypothetical protein U1F58_03630 [Burkholderiales bacterium]
MSRRRLVAALALAAGLATAADAPRELHGSSDAFAAPGVALAWGVLRGRTEATTTVIVRVVTDPQRYPWLALVGIDPFTRAEQPVLRATEAAGAFDVRIPRAQFADFPRTELRLFARAADTRDGTPALVVFYHGVPDTTPEFADPAQLDAHLAARVAALGASAGKPP